MTYPSKAEAGEDDERPPANVINSSWRDLNNNNYFGISINFFSRFMNLNSQTQIQFTNPPNACARARMRVVEISEG